jgi:PAS domain S-box-containing protein
MSSDTVPNVSSNLQGKDSTRLFRKLISTNNTLPQGSADSAVTESLHAGETKILEMIAKGSPLTEVLDTLTRFIESQTNGIHCALAFIDAELRIRPASGPSLPPEYNGTLDGVPIFPYIGPCGMAAYLKQQVISENIERDSRWSDGFRSITQSFGLNACWSTPIFDSRRSVIGTFAIYLERPSTPNAHHLRLIEIATRLAGVAIERQRREERLHLCAEIINRSTEAITISDHNDAIVEQNAAHRKLFGLHDDVLKGKTCAVIFGEDQSSRVLAALHKSERFNGELFARINGESRSIEVSMFTVRNNDSKVVCRVTQSRDVTERRKVEESLRHSHTELESQVMQRTVDLQNLSYRLLRTQDEERRRVARDLHDSTGQTLTALKMAVATLQGKFSEDQDTANALSDVAEIADRALQEIRTTSYLLHPPLLDESGFASAARWYVEGFAQRSGTAVGFNFPDFLGRMPDAVEMALFRILQESLTNVHRHSGSKKAEVSVHITAKNVTMAVTDSGCGLPAAVLERFRTSGSNVGVGLVGMRERVRELGGQLQIESSAEGTVVTASLPIQPELK